MFISPYSISIASLMCYFASRTETAKQLRELLGIGDLNDDDILKLNKEQVIDLNVNDDSQGLSLNTANKIFVNDRLEIKDDYVDLLKEHFRSEATRLNFSDKDNSIKLINDWVKEQTREKIPELLKPGSLNESSKLVLVNAVYFKAGWEVVFDSFNTEKDDFKLSNGQKIKVDMMKLKKKKFHYIENPAGLKAKACQLLYRGYRVLMTIILPNPDVSLNEIELNLTDDSLNELLSVHGSYVKINLHLPKFRMEYESEVSFFCDFLKFFLDVL